MAWSTVHLLPLITFILLPASFIITYVMSVLLGHVAPEFPYISDTGTVKPESCIFSQLLNICTFMIGMTIYIRYKQVEQYHRDHLSLESGRILNRNWICLIIGFISCFGLSMVANFQETGIFMIHMIGATLCFGSAAIYCWIQTWMSFGMIPLVNSRRVAIIRLILSCIMSSTFLISMICGPLSFKWYVHDAIHFDPRKWKPGDGGYPLHVASSIAEWVTAMSVDFFILTYVREMHKLSLSSPKILIAIENTEVLNSNQEDNLYSSDETHVEVVKSNRQTSRDMGMSSSQSGSIIIH